MNLIIYASNYDTIIPLFLLQNEENQNLQREWNQEWKGHELTFTWYLLTSMPRTFVHELLKIYFDENKSQTICKNGFVNKDSTCDVLVRYYDFTSKFCHFYSIKSKNYRVIKNHIY
jgi:hypothetical protein